MTFTAPVILLLAAAICFLLAAFNARTATVNLTALGLVFATVAALLLL